MSAGIPSNTQAIKQAWSDTWRVFQQLPLQAFVAFAVIFVATVAQDLLQPSPVPINDLDEIRPLLSRSAIEIPLAFVQAFLLTPFLIAVHRLIILGERATGYAIAPTAPRFLRFFGWSIVMSILGYLTLLVPLVVPVDVGVRFILMGVLAVAGVVIWLHVVMLFPAIAVDAPGAGWRNVWADSAGNGYNILLIFIGTYVPAVILYLIAIIGFGTPSQGSSRIVIRQILEALPLSVVYLIFYVMAIVIASRLFEWLGDKLKQPA